MNAIVQESDYMNKVVSRLALIGSLLSRPLESLKPEQAQEIFDSTLERITRTLLGVA